MNSSNTAVPTYRRLLPRPGIAALPWLAGAFALGAVVTQIVFFSMTIVRQNGPGVAAVRVVAAPTALALTPSLAALFGAPKAAVGAEVPSSRPLVLTAVIATSDPARGFGIIGENAQVTAMYAVGAALPDGARLIEVYPDRVILDRAGQREVLALPRTELAGGMLPALTSAVADASRPAGEVPNAAELERARIAEADEILTPRGRARAKARALGLPEGGAGGLTLRPSSRYQHADGVRMGDVVVSINGRDVNDVQNLVEALSQTVDTGGTMVVRRQGELVTVKLQPEN
jgi:general secretion pathway protein C